MNVTPFDPARRFVRVVEQRPDGLVEFEFAVGEPELFVEMLLPAAAFEAFCAAQGVTPAPPEAMPTPQRIGNASEDAPERADTAWTWTLHEAVRRELDAAAQATPAHPPAPPAS